MLPFVAIELIRAWTQTKYYLMPLVWVGVATMMWREWRRDRNQVVGSPSCASKGRTIVAELLTIISLGFFIFGVYDKSSLYTTYAFLSTLVAAGLGLLTRLSWPSIIAMGAVLFTTVSLPSGWNKELEWQFNSLVSPLCSVSLDALSIPHLMTGQIVDLRGMTLNIGEIGTHTLGVEAMISLTCLLLLLRGNSLVVSLCSLTLLPLWIIMNNYSTVMLIAIGNHFLARDLSNGWDYWLVVLLSFVYAFGFVWLATKLIERIFEPLVTHGFSNDMLIPAGLTWLFSWPNKLQSFQEAEDDSEKEVSQLAPVNSKYYDQRKYAIVTVYAFGIMLLLLLSMASASTAVVEIASQLLPSQIAKSVEKADACYIQLPIEKTILPEQIDKWKLLNFQMTPIKRGEGEAQNAVWEYYLDGKKVSISVILTYGGSLNPRNDLREQGWRVLKAAEGQAEREGEADSRWESKESQFQDELGFCGYLLCSTITPARKKWDDCPITSSFAGSRPEGWSIEWCQVRLFCESVGVLDLEERDEMRLMLDQVIAWLDCSRLQAKSSS